MRLFDYWVLIADLFVNIPISPSMLRVKILLSNHNFWNLEMDICTFACKWGHLRELLLLFLATSIHLEGWACWTAAQCCAALQLLSRHPSNHGNEVGVTVGVETDWPLVCSSATEWQKAAVRLAEPHRVTDHEQQTHHTHTHTHTHKSRPWVCLSVSKAGKIRFQRPVDEFVLI